ncbi:transmembrane protein 183-like [Saccoglossus kowalevskii]
MKIEPFTGYFMCIYILVLLSITGTQRQKKTTSIIGTSDNIIKGCEYPIDVWFLVSNYIRPEDVGRFASICKASYYVTSTTQFWSRLYHRFCATHDELPVSLKPNAMQKIFKLRACVIRSLFFTYPPYRSRTRSTVPLDSETPHSLEHSKCLYMWVSHKHQTNKTWNFSFKFQMPSLKNQKFSDLGVNYDHLWANSEENCCILSVVCSHFIRVPAIMGMILTKVYLNVSRDMRFFNLKLVFHTLREKGSYSKNNGVTVTLDPVINAKVLHWWHPHYAGNE